MDREQMLTELKRTAEKLAELDSELGRIVYEVGHRLEKCCDSTSREGRFYLAKMLRGELGEPSPKIDLPDLLPVSKRDEEIGRCREMLKRGRKIIEEAEALWSNVLDFLEASGNHKARTWRRYYCVLSHQEAFSQVDSFFFDVICENEDRKEAGPPETSGWTVH